jgi:hypothetical protein
MCWIRLKLSATNARSAGMGGNCRRSVSLSLGGMVDDELIEFICNDNQQFDVE